MSPPNTDLLTRMESKIDEIHSRLFVDNGTPCFQTRLDRHDSVIKVITWLAGTTATAVIGVVVALIIK